jgi:NADPH:quinone reductase-like Zn-dependent oxidoreductase
VRALTISAHGGLDQLEIRDDLPIPEVPPGHIRVRLKAAALNHLDLWTLRGLPGITITPRWILGADGAGVVDAISESPKTDVAIGDSVIINPGISDRTCEYCLEGEQSLCVNFKLLGEHLPGTLAEYVVVPIQNVARIDIPAKANSEAFIDAAAFPLVTLTAWRMLVTQARLQPMEDILIWGIGGGVALAALKIAKRIGARVWVTSGSDEKLKRAKELGADEVLNYKKVDVGKEIRARTTKRGVDVVVDNVGQASWAQSLTALGRRGRLVVCGATSGPMVETDLRKLFWNQWKIIGSTMGNDAEFAAVAAEFNKGNLIPTVDSVFELGDARKAFERLDSSEQFGKIVVRIDQ